MKRIAHLVVPAILLGILGLGSLIIILSVGTLKQARRARVTAVMKTINRDMEFWEVVRAGMAAAAKEFDVDLQIVGPFAESDVGGQIAVMETAVKAKPDAIILSSTDFTLLVPLVERAHREGVPVVTIDSGVDSALPLSFVATNNVEAGEKAGKAMAELLPSGASIAIISHVKGATTAIEREEGARKALAENGKVDVVGTWFTNNYVENAYIFARQLVETGTGISGILALNEVSTVGAGRALRDLGLGGKIRLVGFDSSLFEIKLIEEGILDATVIQQPFNMGYRAVRAARDAVDGKKPERFIDTGSILISAENMYTPENQKILFPFVDRIRD